MAGKSVSKATRQAVYERDGWRCAACGSAWDLTIQHRVSKGMGGSKTLDRLPNLLTLCNLCNTRLEADADFAASGRERGWKVKRNRPGETPETSPVVYGWCPGQWYLLSDGTCIRDDVPF